ALLLSRDIFLDRLEANGCIIATGASTHPAYLDKGDVMSRLTAKDFAPELLELYDFYAHGRITKREFLNRAARCAVGGLTATAILASMRPNYALAQQVSFTDPGITAEY